MTPEMAFECLLVSPDPAVFSTMDGILQDLSISTHRCTDPSKAGDLLTDGGPDLIVIDLEANRSSEFLNNVHHSRTHQKPTVLAVSSVHRVVPGAHVFLRKPVTREAGVSSLKAAYSRMVRDYRKHTRISLMTKIVANDENNRALPLTVTNIGEGGVGLSCKENLPIGTLLSFQLRLPELKQEISLHVRVLWTRQYGAAGCEFIRVPEFDIQLLYAWLESRYRFKKPVATI
jgi:CheY-like chemotaxis protein